MSVIRSCSCRVWVKKVLGVETHLHAGLELVEVLAALVVLAGVCSSISGLLGLRIRRIGICTRALKDERGENGEKLALVKRSF